MSPLLTNLLLLFFGLTLAVSVVFDLLLARRIKRFLITAGILAGFAAVLHLTVGFPRATHHFGPSEELLAVAIMLVSVLAGMAANHFFYAKGPFVVREFIRPLFVSPIVLLPLLGSVGGAKLEALQFICFAFLAFQNGFFWQRIMADAGPTT